MGKGLNDLKELAYTIVGATGWKFMLQSWTCKQSGGRIPSILVFLLRPSTYRMGPTHITEIIEHNLLYTVY